MRLAYLDSNSEIHPELLPTLVAFSCWRNSFGNVAAVVAAIVLQSNALSAFANTLAHMDTPTIYALVFLWSCYSIGAYGSCCPAVGRRNRSLVGVEPLGTLSILGSQLTLVCASIGALAVA